MTQVWDLEANLMEYDLRASVAGPLTSIRRKSLFFSSNTSVKHQSWKHGSQIEKKLVIEKERVLTVAFVFPRKDKVQKIV